MMRETSTRQDSRIVELPGFAGSNPLGFLAALGTAVTLHRGGHVQIRLAWRRQFDWIAVLTDVPFANSDALINVLSEELRGRPISSESEARRKSAEKAFNAAKQQLAKKRKEIRKRFSGMERRAAMDRELPVLSLEVERLRDAWRAALADAVARPELALGKSVDCTPDEYRDHARSLLTSSSVYRRETVDLLAAFASDASVEKNGRVVPTPFCFIRGSGHQYFLDTVRQLMQQVAADRLRRTLFEPWGYEDEGLSLRWDPVEAHQYALMDRDPGPIGAHTQWMANLLAYRALVLFSSAPARGKLLTTAWGEVGEESVFTWPIWDKPLTLDGIRSLLQMPELFSPAPDRAVVRSRGLEALFRARRIKIGEGANFKINFSPAGAV